jgi:Rrf2 family protein
MSATSVQFAVATHLMAALAFRHGEEIHSSTLAGCVNADATFVRKSLSKLSKAGLIVTRRGRRGASVLARSARRITLLDIYRASEAPPAFAIHNYPVEKRCAVSSNIKGCLSKLLEQAQENFEKTLAQITLAELVGDIRAQSH